MNQLFGDIYISSAKMCRLALFKSSFPNDVKYS